MDLKELSDRMEIQDLMVDYCYAIDTRDWDALDSIFTADAVIDYSEMVGFRGSVAETKAFLASSMAAVQAAQHIISTSKITVTGDTATGKTVCNNPMVLQPRWPCHVRRALVPRHLHAHRRRLADQFALRGELLALQRAGGPARQLMVHAHPADAAGVTPAYLTGLIAEMHPGVVVESVTVVEAKNLWPADGVDRRAGGGGCDVHGRERFAVAAGDQAAARCRRHHGTVLCQ